MVNGKCCKLLYLLCRRLNTGVSMEDSYTGTCLLKLGRKLRWTTDTEQVSFELLSTSSDIQQTLPIYQSAGLQLYDLCQHILY